MIPEQPWVWLARIRKSQGRKGEVLADLLTDFPDKFQERKRVWLLSAAGQPTESAREAELVGHFLHKGGVVLHFAGIASIPEADALRGQIVAIPHSERAPLPGDEVYVGDLIGSRLVDISGPAERFVGLIEDVDREAGPVALLVVAGPKKEEILIPFARAYLRKIEPGRVEMALPEGLVEVQTSPAGSPPPEEA